MKLIPHSESQITTVLLNGGNYTLWAKSTSLFLYGKFKLGFVMGKVVRPEKFDPTYDEWEANDRIVMFWLLNSMDPVIAEGFLFLNSIKKIWDSLADI